MFTFKSKDDKTQEIWKTGIDVRVRPKTITILDARGKEVDVVDKCNNENHGLGKYFSGSLYCNHKGKKIPCKLFVSKSRRITAEILVKVLKK